MTNIDVILEKKYSRKQPRLITVKLPEHFVEGLDTLVRMGRYSTRSEAIRIAIRDLLKKELWDKK